MPSVIGHQRPRLSSIPLNVYSSLGEDAIELSSLAGLFLDDWQSWSLGHILSLKKNGKWAAFECCEIVGRQNGKGAILEARELAGLFQVPTDVEILHTAHLFPTARKHFYRLKYLIDNTPDLYRRVDKFNESHGQEAIILLPTPTRIMGSDHKYVTQSVTKMLEIVARSKGSGRGFTSDLLVYDESMILDVEKVGATLPTLSARPNPQVIYMASAGFKTSTQLAKVRRRGTNKSVRPRSLFFAEWSINAHDEYCEPSCRKHDTPGTVKSYQKSNPAYGIRIDADYLANEREAFEGGEIEWMRERLGVGEYPAPLDGWLVIPKKWFNDTLDGSKDPPKLTNVIFAVHISSDRGTSAIAVAGNRPDGLTGIEIVECRSGTKWLYDRIIELHEKHYPDRWIINPRASTGTLIVSLEAKDIPVEKMTTTDVSHASGLLFDGFRDGLLRHLGQAKLRAALAGADKRVLSETWAFDEKNTAVDLTTLMAITFAYWGYLEFGMDYENVESVHFDINEVVRMVHYGVYGPADLARLRDDGILSADDFAAVQAKLEGTDNEGS